MFANEMHPINHAVTITFTIPPCQLAYKMYKADERKIIVDMCAVLFERNC